MTISIITLYLIVFLPVHVLSSIHALSFAQIVRNLRIAFNLHERMFVQITHSWWGNRHVEVWYILKLFWNNRLFRRSRYRNLRRGVPGVSEFYHCFSHIKNPAGHRRGGSSTNRAVLGRQRWSLHVLQEVRHIQLTWFPLVPFTNLASFVALRQVIVA